MAMEKRRVSDPVEKPPLCLHQSRDSLRSASGRSTHDPALRSNRAGNGPLIADRQRRGQHQRHLQTGLPEELVIFVNRPKKGYRTVGEPPCGFPRQTIAERAGGYAEGHHDLMPGPEGPACDASRPGVEGKELDHVPATPIFRQEGHDLAQSLRRSEVVLEDEPATGRPLGDPPPDGDVAEVTTDLGPYERMPGPPPILL